MDGIEATRRICAAAARRPARSSSSPRSTSTSTSTTRCAPARAASCSRTCTAETLFEAVRVVAARRGAARAGGHAPPDRRVRAPAARVSPPHPTGSTRSRRARPRSSGSSPRASPTGDRRAARRQRRDGEDARQPRPAQARAARPGAGGGRRLRVRAGRTARLRCDEALSSFRTLSRSSSGLTIVNAQSSPARIRAVQSSEPTRMRSSVCPSRLGELGERCGKTPRRLLQRQVEQHLDLVAPRRARERAADVGDGIEVVGRRATAACFETAARRIRSTRNVRRSRRSWSYAARYQRPECTTSPCGLSSRCVSLAREGRVAGPQPQAPADRVRQQQHRPAGRRARRSARTS